jgi:hypothetical protein
MKKFFLTAIIVFVIYFVGSIIFVIFLMLKCAGKIKISNPRAVPRVKPRMIIVSNHPDALNCMYEIILVPALFILQGFSHPVKFAPRIPADKRNFTDKWYWAWFKPFAIPIVRGKKNNAFHEARVELDEMFGAMAERGIIISFIEPGRTCTGKEFLYSESGRNCIRVIPDTVGLLASRIEGVSVGLVWVGNGKMVPQPGKKLFSWPNLMQLITVGFSEISAELFVGKDSTECTRLVVTELLRLADRTTQG